MISKAKIKFIKSLESKKGRRQEGCFVAEGPKVVADLLGVFKLRMLVATDKWIAENKALANAHYDVLEEVSEEDLRKCSFLQHPQRVMAIFYIPEKNSEALKEISARKSLILALDSVQDPGNLGTIIRIADWFGIEDIVCSQETADAYNPKVIQATMGSIARTRLHYCNLKEWLCSQPNDIPVYGTFLDGEDITRQSSMPENSIIVMGNEGNGISNEVASHITNRLLIPSYPHGRQTADSLNVAIATALTCFYFKLKH